MTPIIDLHCHPTLKIYLCEDKIYRKHPLTIPGIPLGMEVDLHGMQRSDVRVAFCSHYIPEEGFRRLPRSEWFFNFLLMLGLRIMHKFEETGANDDAYTEMKLNMTRLENQVRKARNKGFKVSVAKNLAAFETEFQKGNTILLHSAEGSHQLGRNANSAIYLTRLRELKEEGLAMLTIAHFFKNDICDTGGGIPKDIADNIGYSVPPPVDNGQSFTGLSPTGHDVVNFCQEEGIIIDLVHCNGAARAAVFALIKQRKDAGLKTRPVIFSHSGYREYAVSRGMTHLPDIAYLPSKAELQQVKEYGGVLGLILFDYWITGDKQAFQREQKIRTKEQVEALETKRINDLIDLVRRVCLDIPGFEENISIGTDMDGFTHVPDDVRHSRFMYKLRDRFTAAFGKTIADKILCGNALRVIREGWS